MKKLFWLIISFCLTMVMTGCVTQALYKDSPSQYRNYVEEVNSFLITGDGRQLIVVGKQYHYIFAADDDTLKFILSWPEKKKVKAGFENFSITNNQTISGAYTLTVDAGQNLAKNTADLLIAKGFVNNAAQKTLVYHGTLYGTRYAADKFVLPATFQLNQTYAIAIREESISASNTLGRLLLTPLALAADGALLIGGIPVFLLTGSLNLLNK